MDDLAIIDAHHHFWDLALGQHPALIAEVDAAHRYGDITPIRQNYLPGDYLRDCAGHNVVKNVHMEAEWRSSDPVGETKWLHALHDATGYPHAMVGQVHLERADAGEILARHAAYPLVRSVRQKPAAAASPDAFVAGAPGSMADPAFRDGYRRLAHFGLHYDLQTPWWHLGEAADLARDFPDILVILNHAGLPHVGPDDGLSGWREAMARFADRPNTAVKISGLGVRGLTWAAAGNEAIVREVLRIFGPERCLFASNFPFDRLCASFDEIYAAFKAITADLSATKRRMLFHDNAARIYRPV